MDVFQQPARTGETMKIKKAAVMGAGAMGTGIAHALASAGMEVLLIDVGRELVERGVQKIDARCASEVKKGKLAPEEKGRIMDRIRGSVSHRDGSDAELIIEAVIEERTIKGELFRSLDRICPRESIFATNTSTLSITGLGNASGRPERFLGLHFFNPVHAMRLVEVIPGLDTAKAVIDGAVELTKSIGKAPVLVQDCPGFLVNRVLLAYIGEALLSVQEGTAPEEIDRGAKQEGFPMGPLELSDMVGWDVSLHTLPILNDAYGERFPFPEIVRKLNDAGRLGMKTGKGIYSEGKVDDEFGEMVKSIGARKGNEPFSADRIILRQVNEAIHCLQEGVASAEEIDRAMVLGTGFPNQAGIGGPLHWADQRGLDWVLATLQDLTEQKGTRFWPHHLLKKYVAAGRLGRKSGRGFFDY
ncbi:MAG: 3-hydroxyacyl-CoA dehydrogenase [Desulfobacteraceae bacterium]|nr:MAG: 3-hydroxyacyl-CoA dehydrogenase [Desulfobacteraceae bacterium]